MQIAMDYRLVQPKRRQAKWECRPLSGPRTPPSTTHPWTFLVLHAVSLVQPVTIPVT